MGFYNIRKPQGPTSHDVVARVRRLLPRKTRVGHAGTLDPFADGVLVVCVGHATRLAEYVQRSPKRYRARIRLGARSTTDDPMGEIVQAPDASAPPEQALREALRRFVGEIEQTPPAHSAVHVDGQRAYKLARRGEAVELPPRLVRVYGVDLMAYAYPHVDVDIRCGSGTYIRSIARDVGEALGVGGYCDALTRTEVGPFHLADAVELDALDPARDLQPPRMGLADLACVTVGSEGEKALTYGQAVRVEGQVPEGEIALLSEGGQLLAIGRKDPGSKAIRPGKVFCVVEDA